MITTMPSDQNGARSGSSGRPQACRPLPYSFLYAPDGFDVTGRIRDGVGVTCATFVINIFDRLQLRIVDLSTWKPRPKQDQAFRQRIINYAIALRNVQLAQRLSAESKAFA
jgi:hypothetical protein